MSGAELTEVRLLRKGHRGNADLYEAKLADRPVVVKDFREKGFWVRGVVGPFSIRRERRVAGKLLGVAGIVRVHDAPMPGRVVMDRITGEPLSSAPPGSIDAEVFARLDAIVLQLHQRRIVHGDLSHRGNVLLDADGRPWVIDLASAFDLGWLGPLAGPFVRLLGFFDRAAVAKWKKQLCKSPLTTEEERALSRLMFWRRFWVLNPKVR
ncbi:MAG: phosphotransferase [Acidobacteriota bacterium]